MEKFNLPLDVMVLDMNWHSKDGWTGFQAGTRQLFPYPNDTLAMLHSQGLLTSANIHDADGLGKWEDSYAQNVCRHRPPQQRRHPSRSNR